MNRVLVLAGAFLLTLGLVSLKYDHYSWSEEKTKTISTPIIDLELPGRQVHTLAVPPELSWAVAVAGWVLLLAGVFARKENADAGRRPVAQAGPSSPSAPSPTPPTSSEPSP